MSFYQLRGFADVGVMCRSKTAKQERLHSKQNACGSHAASKVFQSPVEAALVAGITERHSSECRVKTTSLIIALDARCFITMDPWLPSIASYMTPPRPPPRLSPINHDLRTSSPRQASLCTPLRNRGMRRVHTVHP
jgi:hypothetical protein